MNTKMPGDTTHEQIMTGTKNKYKKLPWLVFKTRTYAQNSVQKINKYVFIDWPREKNNFIILKMRFKIDSYFKFNIYTSNERTLSFKWTYLKKLKINASDESKHKQTRFKRKIQVKSKLNKKYHNEEVFKLNVHDKHY